MQNVLNRNSYQVSVETPAGNNPLGKVGRGGEYIIKRLKERGVRV